ncbi:LacI family DNA-binding transcriptional regulator [Parenemella sanctibonifatiensis]|nr:LacI family DNA-binding transcriptional regulator [Parenemella sanctibonifatiensis]
MTETTGTGMAPPPRRPSIKDVAKRAGVSWKTVSNVLHDRPHVRAENRAAVQAAIAELGYRTSLAGRQLRQGRTSIAALALPDITSPYFAALAQELIHNARGRGLTVLIDETGGDPERELAAAGGYDMHFADGVIMSPISVHSFQINEVQPRSPLVLLGEREDLAEQSLPYDHVAIDNPASAVELTRHLLDQGCRRFGFIGAEERFGTGYVRHQGVRSALAEAGLELVASAPAEAWTRPAGEEAASELLASVGHQQDRAGRTDPGIDALICGNDLLAIGAMRTLRQQGIRIGAEVAVAGWDDIPEAAYAEPGLTTVGADLAALVDAALDRLEARIAGADEPAVVRLVPHRLHLRVSTQRA